MRRLSARLRHDSEWVVAVDPHRGFRIRRILRDRRSAFLHVLRPRTALVLLRRLSARLRHDSERVVALNPRRVFRKRRILRDRHSATRTTVLRHAFRPRAALVLMRRLSARLWHDPERVVALDPRRVFRKRRILRDRRSATRTTILRHAFRPRTALVLLRRLSARLRHDPERVALRRPVRIRRIVIRPHLLRPAAVPGTAAARSRIGKTDAVIVGGLAVRLFLRAKDGTPLLPGRSLPGRPLFAALPAEFAAALLRKSRCARQRRAAGHAEPIAGLVGLAALFAVDARAGLLLNPLPAGGAEQIVLFQHCAARAALTEFAQGLVLLVILLQKRGSARFPVLCYALRQVSMAASPRCLRSRMHAPISLIIRTASLVGLYWKMMP